METAELIQLPSGTRFWHDRATLEADTFPARSRKCTLTALHASNGGQVSALCTPSSPPSHAVLPSEYSPHNGFARWARMVTVDCTATEPSRSRLRQRFIPPPPPCTPFAPPTTWPMCIRERSSGILCHPMFPPNPRSYLVRSVLHMTVSTTFISHPP